MSFTQAVEFAGKGLDVVGVAVILLATLSLLAYSAARLIGGKQLSVVFRLLRRELGQGILLGLEILVAADIVRTVAVSPTIQSVAVLGVIVLIRTFLSFSLEVELTGRWPWQSKAVQPPKAE